MGLLFMLFGNNLEICGFISKRGLLSCSHKACFVFHFKLHQYGKSMLAKIGGNKRHKNLKDNFSDMWIPFHLVARKHLKTCDAKGVFFCVVFLEAYLINL